MDLNSITIFDSTLVKLIEGAVKYRARSDSMTDYDHGREDAWEVALSLFRALQDPAIRGTLAAGPGIRMDLDV